MHYKNGRPAEVGDWVVGTTHNSEGKLRVGYVKELMPHKGNCNVKLHVWTQLPEDWAGGYQPPVPAYKTLGGDDYAFCANLIHVTEGYRLASICADAWKWDSQFNPAPPMAPSTQ